MASLLPTASWRRFLSKLKGVPKAREAAIISALTNSAEVILARAKGHYLTGAALKVRTGRLRGSVTKGRVIKVGKAFYISVGTNVKYGRYWEEGFYRRGRYYAPRRWLRPAFNDSKRDIRNILRKIGIQMSLGG